MSKKFERYKSEIIETENRWITFIGKLKERIIELCEASIPELIAEYQNDKDEHKRAYCSMVSGIVGQINNVEQKADEVCDNQVIKILDKIQDKVMEDDELSDLVDGAIDRCSELLQAFSDFASKWTDTINETTPVDLEKEYQAILDEHEQIKDKFTCKQCGSIIPLPKLLFMITHLQCPACQTQNTFTPSTRASQLEYLGKELAKQRTKHLYMMYEAENNKDQEIYNQIHNLELSVGFDEEEINQKLKTQIAELEISRKKAIANTPKLHKKYLRAMFDELNKIVPDLKEENEKVYLSCLKENYLENVNID